MKRQVLIIQTAFTGDVILALPLAQRIREEWPEAIIHFLVRKGNENLLEHNPAIDTIWVWDKRQNKISNLFSLVSQLRQFHFDLALNCQRFFSTGLLMFLLKAKEKRGFSENPLSNFYSQKFPHTLSSKGTQNPIHEVSRNLSLLSGLMPTKIIPPKIVPTLEELNKVKSLIPEGKWIVLAPASVWFTKQWPLERWKELISLLPDDFIPILVGAPGDYELAEQVLINKKGGQNLCGKLSLRESAALMFLAHRVVCNDSAPLHLASAVSAPISAVFCSTIPEFGFYPLSPDSIIIQEAQGLTCRPCGLHGKKSCPESHFKCGFSISAQQVLESIR